MLTLVFNCIPSALSALGIYTQVWTLDMKANRSSTSDLIRVLVKLMYLFYTHCQQFLAQSQALMLTCKPGPVKVSAGSIPTRNKASKVYDVIKSPTTAFRHVLAHAASHQIPPSASLPPLYLGPSCPPRGSTSPVLQLPCLRLLRPFYFPLYAVEIISISDQCLAKPF